MERPVIFISHISEEKLLASILKTHLQRDFLDMIDVFVSSDDESIGTGSKWLFEVSNALKNANLQLVLCSDESVNRPWINFESGAAWVSDIPIVPVCHSGIIPAELPVPLSMLQAVEARKETGISKIYNLIGQRIGSNTPSPNLNQIISDIQAFEEVYIEKKAI